MNDSEFLVFPATNLIQAHPARTAALRVGGTALQGRAKEPCAIAWVAVSHPGHPRRSRSGNCLDIFA